MLISPIFLSAWLLTCFSSSRFSGIASRRVVLRSGSEAEAYVRRRTGACCGRAEARRARRACLERVLLEAMAVFVQSTRSNYEEEMFRVQKSPCGSDRPCGEASGGAKPEQRTCGWLCKQNGLRMKMSSKRRYRLEVSGVIIRLARYKYSRSSNAVPALAASSSPRPVNSFIRGMNNIPVFKRLADSRAFLGKAATSKQLHQLHHSGRYSPLLSSLL